MNWFLLPLAFDETVVKAIIGGIMVILWAAGHLLSDKGKAKPAARPRPQAPPGPPPGGGAAGKPASLEETLRREVEEFMRRAQGREPAEATKRPAAPPQRGPQRQPQSKPAAAKKPPAKAPPRRLADSRQPSPIAIEEGQGALTGATISQHVAEHLGGAKAIATHAQTLGSDVAQADERLEAHLQEKFAHRLGKLAHKDVEPQAAAKSTAATDLLKLLSQPGGARTMIVANEILRRPEERWRSGTRSLRRGS